MGVIVGVIGAVYPEYFKRMIGLSDTDGSVRRKRQHQGAEWSFLPRSMVAFRSEESDREGVQARNIAITHPSPNRNASPVGACTGARCRMASSSLSSLSLRGTRSPTRVTRRLPQEAVDRFYRCLITITRQRS
ncbi:MAG: hypothetical protein CMJ39_12555 [Phycisphaerae bacterium]|nr:hypothetical protein [Phycisphaerae bacterium]